MTAEGPESRADEPRLDPWGLGQVEELISGLEGVESLKIVPDGHGGIDEVHVVGTTDVGAKQIVRNIESALLAEFGLQIDHRKISIAQRREPDISAAPEGDEDVSPVTGTRRLILDTLEIERKAGRKVICRVTLRGTEKQYTGSAEGPDFSRSRLEVAGQATLEALNKSTLEDISLRLDGISKIPIAGRELVAALVQGKEGRRTVPLAGITLVSDSPEEAAVLACLHATNRWAGAV